MRKPNQFRPGPNGQQTHQQAVDHQRVEAQGNRERARAHHQMPSGQWASIWKTWATARCRPRTSGRRRKGCFRPASPGRSQPQVPRAGMAADNDQEDCRQLEIRGSLPIRRQPVANCARSRAARPGRSSGRQSGQSKTGQAALPLADLVGGDITSRICPARSGETRPALCQYASSLSASGDCGQ